MLNYTEAFFFQCSELCSWQNMMTTYHMCASKILVNLKLRNCRKMRRVCSQEVYLSPRRGGGDNLVCAG